MVEERRSLKLTVVSIAILAVIFAAFWPVRSNGFVEYDDQDYLFKNVVVQQGLTPAGLKWAFTTGHSGNWHPLTWISHMVDLELFGLGPGAHHLSNVAIHACNSVVLFLFLAAATRRIWASAIIATIFALHPLRVESVAWASERKDLLCGFFVLLTLCAYLRYAQNRKSERYAASPALYWYLLSLVLFSLALLSKPMAVTLPFVLLLLDFWPLRFGDPNTPIRKRISGLLIEKIPFLALAAVSSFVTLQVQQAARLHLQHLGFGERMANALVSYTRYLGKAFYPFDLAVLYPHPGTWPTGTVIISGLLLFGLTAFAASRWRSAPWTILGWFWFLGMLVPVIGLVQVGVQSIADRYTYLPLIGVTILVVWELSSIQERFKIPKAAFGLIFLGVTVVCFMETRRQLPVWKNTETLFTHALAVTSDNWVAHSNLGSEALRQYQALSESQTPGGTALLKRAVFHCEKALQIQPGFADVHIILSKAAIELGDLHTARRHVTEALRLSPANPEAHQNMAEILYREGRIAEAVNQYREALKNKSDWEPVLNNLAWILATDPADSVRNGSEAVRLAERACELTSYTNVSFLNTLGAAYAEAGDFRRAQQTQAKALDLAMQSRLKPETEKSRTRLELYQRERPLRAQ